MTSTDAQDRADRRARHAQRVDAIRRQREERQRPARTGAAAQLDNPFGAIGADADMQIAERAFG